jgi:eukaryotic-like serine/threonine-protein kinase
MSPGEGMRDLCAIFEHTLDEAPARRDAYLSTVCANRPGLRRRIARLMALAESRAGFLDRSPLRRTTAARPLDRTYGPGHRVGSYRLTRRLGSGGMAEVWLAECVDGKRPQRVAVKISRARDAVGVCFAAEREILGSLAHPGIVELHGGGLDAAGSAYIVMEYVEGEHLIAYCEARCLGLDERLSLFLEVCDIVSYAHAHRVVHRDLKPSNILVAADGVVKLLDFGISKVLDRDDAGEAARPIRLSPAYAAPEELAGGRAGTSADVHALGVILFELLTGTLPWASEASSLTLAVKRLFVTDAPPPSRAVTAGSPFAAGAIVGDLDAIVGMALRRDPRARYADARALADDLRRYLDHEPFGRRFTCRAPRRAAPSPSPSRVRPCVR